MMPTPVPATIPLTITRNDSNQRMSQSVVHGDTVYLAGQVANNGDGDATTQTEQVLQKIDERLATAGTDKSKLLSAVIYLSDIRHFDATNAMWDGWVDSGNTPARATVEARLARPDYIVEIMVVGAK